MRSPTVPPKLQRIAAQAAHDPPQVLTTLAQLSDVDCLREAYRLPRKRSAPGIDGVTAQQSAEHLDENLHDLHERLRSRRSQAQPGERVWSEQEDGKQRPIGKPPGAEQLVQRAGAMRREALSEQDCSDSSYGFRRGRSPHDALEARRERCMRDHLGWSVEAEGSGDVESIDRTRWREVLRRRVHDGRLLRLLGKWLHAGVMEEGGLSHPDPGVVQGEGISPGLAKVCLHHVLEEWFAQAGHPRLRGRSFLMRFAADFVLGGALQADAHRVMAVLPKRFARDGLPMPPTKPAGMAFGKPATPPGSPEGNGTGDVLGLPHDGTRSRRGDGVIKRRTAKKRLRRTSQSLGRWGRPNRHAPLPYQDQQ